MVWSGNGYNIVEAALQGGLYYNIYELVWTITPE